MICHTCLHETTVHTVRRLYSPPPKEVRCSRCPGDTCVPPEPAPVLSPMQDSVEKLRAREPGWSDRTTDPPESPLGLRPSCYQASVDPFGDVIIDPYDGRVYELNAWSHGQRVMIGMIDEPDSPLTGHPRKPSIKASPARPFTSTPYLTPMPRGVFQECYLGAEDDLVAEAAQQGSPAPPPEASGADFLPPELIEKAVQAQQAAWDSVDGPNPTLDRDEIILLGVTAALNAVMAELAPKSPRSDPRHRHSTPRYECEEA